MSKKYKYHFLDTWKKSKNIFIKPKLKFYFGPWKNEGNLPVWRRGNIIRFGKNYFREKQVNSRYESSYYDFYIKEYEEEWDYAKLKDSHWTEEGKKRHPILSKIVKPSYELPLWLSFYWFNDDIMYKTKWDEDDFRYEFPAHFTVVFFGLCFSITAYIPKKDKDDWLCDDQYWESILTYQYYKGDLKKTNDTCGWYNRPGESGFKFKFDPRFLKNIVDRDGLISIQEKMIPEIIAKYEEEDKEREENKIYGIHITQGNIEDNHFDGWFAGTFEGKVLMYQNEEDFNKIFDNLKKEVQRKKNGILKKIEYKKYIGDRRYFGKGKTMTINKNDFIDKSINPLENIYERNDGNI